MKNLAGIAAAHQPGAAGAKNHYKPKEKQNRITSATKSKPKSKTHDYLTKQQARALLPALQQWLQTDIEEGPQT